MSRRSDTSKSLADFPWKNVRNDYERLVVVQCDAMKGNEKAGLDCPLDINFVFLFCSQCLSLFVTVCVRIGKNIREAPEAVFVFFVFF